jgi:hypothetical protein
MVRVTAKYAFVHDAHRPAKGDSINVSDAVADDLLKAGLIEPFKAEKKAPEPENKKAPEPENKADPKAKTK